MALNTNIALGVRPIEVANPLAQYGQLAQIKAAQQANQLGQMQMAEYERARSEEEGLRNYLAGADLTATETRNALMSKYGKTGREFAKGLTELDKAKTEEAARKAKLAIDKTSMYRDAVMNINSPAEAIEFMKLQATDPDMAGTPISRMPLMKVLSSIPQDPAGFETWKKQTALGMTKFVEQNKPVTFAQDTGAGGRILERPGLGGAATVVPGSEFAKTRTFADINAAARLAFDQQKFAWEKANPGFELKEAEDGSIVGVNKRTLQAVPVTLGGATPAAAAPVAGAGMPSERMPATGTPLRGKGTPMTESQSNATAYGMRMKEANAILEDLSKKGVLKGALIEGVPLVGESLGKVLPSVLGGTSEAQQQVNQAKSNFITAVLRKESGAVISDSEFDREDKKYFPQVNDSPAVIKQKENARKLAIKAIETQAGPGAKSIQQLQPSAGGGVDLSNPLLK